MKITRFLIVACLAFLVAIGEAFARGHKSSGTSSTGTVHVEGYYRKDGTYVAPHERTAPNGTKDDNWSTKGNINPITGKPGTKPGDTTSGSSVSKTTSASAATDSGGTPSTANPSTKTAASTAANPANVTLPLLTPGMTKTQVVAAIGEPNVKAATSWFYTNHGWVRFKDDKVTTVEGK